MNIQKLIKIVLCSTKRKITKFTSKVTTFEKIVIFSQILDIESFNGTVKKESNHILFKADNFNFKLYISKIKNIQTDGNCYILDSDKTTTMVYVKYNGEDERELDLTNLPDKFNELLY